MKIRPIHVLSLVILVVTFVAARFYVSRAIDATTHPIRVDGASMLKRARPKTRSVFERTPRSILGLANVPEAQREAIYQQAREQTASLDQTEAMKLPRHVRLRILALYRRALESELADPVRPELTEANEVLTSWWSPPKPPPNPAGDLKQLVEGEEVGE